MNKILNKKDIIWNTAGSIMSAVVSFILAVVVIKLIGSEKGGIFSFGYSTLSQIALIITYFGIRPYHIVDIRFKFNFDDYYSHRILTALTSIIILLIYILTLFIFGKYTLYKSVILLFIVQSGVLEGFADCFDCEFQRNNKLYFSGKSIFFRNLFYAISLILTLFLTYDLLYACIIAFITKLLIIVYLSIIRYNMIFQSKISIKFNKLSFLTKETYSLFIIAIIDIIIFSLPKLLIDIYISDVYSGLFNLYFMPVNVIYLLVNLIIKPMLTPISNVYYIDRKKYNNIFNKIIFISIIICFVILILSVLFSGLYNYIINTLTNNIYRSINVNIKLIFILNMFGGALYAASAPIYYILIISNKQKLIMYSYFLSLLISLIIGPIMIMNLSIIGASILFIIDNIIILLFLLLIRFKNE